MQSKTTRGVRRLLVSTGVISLVLSVAAPALATPPADAGTPGAQMVKVCHNGRVLEKEAAATQAHLNHGDRLVTEEEGLKRGDECTSSATEPSDAVDTPEAATFVKVCIEGIVDEITEDQVEGLADDIDATVTDLEGLELGAMCGAAIDDEIPKETVGEMFVEVCHEGDVVEVEEHAVDGHLGHGDVLMVDGATCPPLGEEGGIIDGSGPGGPVVVVDPRRDQYRVAKLSVASLVVRSRTS